MLLQDAIKEMCDRKRLNISQLAYYIGTSYQCMYDRVKVRDMHTNSLCEIADVCGYKLVLLPKGCEDLIDSFVLRPESWDSPEEREEEINHMIERDYNSRLLAKSTKGATYRTKMRLDRKRVKEEKNKINHEFEPD